MKKRGIISVQINWIFILIAGVVILVFFVSIINSQRESSDLKVSVSTTSDLNAIFSGVETSPAASILVDIPNRDINFYCFSDSCTDDFGCTSGFSVGDNGIESDRPVGVLFSPDRIIGTVLTLHTLEWYIPFKISNFLYATSPQIRYVLINSSSYSSYISALVDALPPNYVEKDGLSQLAFYLDSSLTDNSQISSLGDNNNYKVRIITFSPIDDTADPSIIPSSITRTDPEDITLLYINPACTDLDCYGNVTFYELNDDKNEFVMKNTANYLGLPSLVGAVISDDFDMFSCNMLKAFKKEDLILSVLSNRSAALYEYYSTEHSDIGCYSLYTDFSFFPDPSFTNIPLTYLGWTQIESYNHNLKVQSCPQLY